ncbi:MAG: L,D-transpeptidase [Rhodobiaceae bacterium]|nr:L,D-transpeptidase [Rhodobiaceae bacterium]MCC0012067.1 L,D-transpeptidase [Rhodobiaceae bacterium]MCC0061017.1 L,D-transpeptidase [Rhodobiaceae bacterium]
MVHRRNGKSWRPPLLTRRNLLLGGIAFVALGSAEQAEAQGLQDILRGILPGMGISTVSYSTRYAPGTIVVEPNKFALYLITSRGRARRYPIGVGAEGRGFRGTGRIGRKAEWPSWTPTPAMIARDPKKYKKYAGGVPGGRGNPLGSRALYLYRGGSDSYFRIHGTNQPSTIGRRVSAGCIRMHNSHVNDLYNRVRVGATIIVR